ncbi:hypothetical protein CCUS01_00929 [Colletotrichum cuscutae]|uniref:Uncharacterized protein n=1 Tax=Colletotrichum cuscutae TaxID=1209917 RepID=A0AAI9V6Y7_9PEZI|nr:hypothetical protein CCUS01_00929 [Colletotrichum cuscutae]
MLTFYEEIPNHPTRAEKYPYMTKSTVTQDEHEVTNHGSRSGTFIPLFPFGTSRQATKSHRERWRSRTEYDRDWDDYTPSGAILRTVDKALSKSNKSKYNRKYPARLQLHGTAFSQPDPEKMHSPYSLTQIYPPPSTLTGTRTALDNDPLDPPPYPRRSIRTEYLSLFSTTFPECSVNAKQKYWNIARYGSSSANLPLGNMTQMQTDPEAIVMTTHTLDPQPHMGNGDEKKKRLQRGKRGDGRQRRLERGQKSHCQIKSSPLDGICSGPGQIYGYPVEQELKRGQAHAGPVNDRLRHNAAPVVSSSIENAELTRAKAKGQMAQQVNSMRPCLNLVNNEGFGCFAPAKTTCIENLHAQATWTSPQAERFDASREERIPKCLYSVLDAKPSSPE